MEIDYEGLKERIGCMSLEETGVLKYMGRDYWVQPNSISGREAGKDAGKPVINQQLEI